MIGLRIVDAVAEQHWLGRLSESVQAVVQKVFDAGGSAGQEIEDVLHGTPVGHPLHPAVTDIPTGAWTAALVLDLFEIMRGRDDLAPGADVAIGVGLAGALAAIPSGITDWHDLDTKPLRVGLIHGIFNLGATALYASSLMLRKRGARQAGHTTAFAGYALMIAGAYLGGDLVYRDQIGVSHAEPVWTSLKWAPVLKDSELKEGDLRRVDVGERHILLVRQGEKLYAMAETCSHLGGPLSDGQLEDGCVVCPWHGSRFDLATGEPVDGPATVPQPCFETRVREGKIEVRAGQ